jgi:hypothetical protein
MHRPAPAQLGNYSGELLTSRDFCWRVDLLIGQANRVFLDLDWLEVKFEKITLFWTAVALFCLLFASGLISGDKKRPSWRALDTRQAFGIWGVGCGRSSH